MKRIYRLLVNMMDGSGYGPRTVEIGNWGGVAFFSPKRDLKAMLDRPEFEKTGIYILKYPGSGPYTETVYIGEADVLRDRMRQHLADPKKNHFLEVMLFTSHTAYITKTQAKYLEHRLISIAKEIGASVHNSNSPSRPNVPAVEIDDLEEFLDCIRVILPIMGFRFLIEPTILEAPSAAPQLVGFQVDVEEEFSFSLPEEEAQSHPVLLDKEPLSIVDTPDSISSPAESQKGQPRSRKKAIRDVPPTAEAAERISPNPSADSLSNPKLESEPATDLVSHAISSPGEEEFRPELFDELRPGKYRIVDKVMKASLDVVDGKFIVKKGSQARKTISNSMSSNYVLLRSQLIESGILKDQGDHFIFTCDHPFTSASAASNIVVGRQSPGPRMWRDENQASLRGIPFDPIA